MVVRARAATPSALVWVIALCAALLPAGVGAQGSVVDLGEGRSAVEVAIALSQATFDAAERVLVSRDDLFADALASGVLQGGGPLLLTPTAALHPDVAAEIARLGATRATLLGDANAVSDGVAASLLGMGLAVDRLAGPTRLETAAEVAGAAVASSTVLVVRAYPATEPTQAFADSLAVGGWSAATGWPVLLTQSDQLSATTAATLAAGGWTDAVLVGGPAALSSQVADDLTGRGLAVRRVSGPNRFATAIDVAVARGFPTAAMARTVILVEGQAVDAWAAGFAGAAASGRWAAPVVLANGAALPAETRAWLSGAGFGAGILAQAEPPTLLCAASAAACEEAARLLGVEPTVDPAPDATVVLDQAGAVVHRNTPLTGTVLPAVGQPMPDVITLSGNCISGSPHTAPVLATGSFEAIVRAAASAGPCEVTATLGGAPAGPAASNLGTLTVEVIDLVLDQTGSFARPGGTITGQLTGTGIVSAVQFDAPCVLPVGTVAGNAVQVGVREVAPMWCAVDATVFFADGGHQVIDGPAVPDIFVGEVGGQGQVYSGLVGDWFTSLEAIGLQLYDGDGLGEAYVYLYGTGPSPWEWRAYVDGFAVDREAFTDALGIGHHLRVDWSDDAVKEVHLTSVDPLCPDGAGLIGAPRLGSPADVYRIDLLGLLQFPIDIPYAAGEVFTVDGVETDVDGFRAAVNPMDCITYVFPLFPGDVSPKEHHLTNRVWLE